jgi:hypothetical protein
MCAWRLPEADRIESKASELPMSKPGVAIGAAGIAVLAALAGCNEPPWTLSRSPAEISLRWYPDTTPSAAADQVAQLHCESWEKSAELFSDARNGSAEIAEYRCR